MYYVTTIRNILNTPTAPPPTLSFEELIKNAQSPTPAQTPTFLKSAPAPFKIIPKFTTHELQTQELKREYIDHTKNKARKFNKEFERTLEYWAKQTMSDHYTRFYIPKASGGQRPIDAPSPNLKHHQRQVLKTLQNLGIHPHDAAFAYVPHRTVKDALIIHQRRSHEWFLKLDLHNFFNSCNKNFINAALSLIPFFASLHNLNLFIHFCCLNNTLPQGSPLSPWLTNQIMLPYDYRIKKQCQQHNIMYTRYADDLLFSSTSRQAVLHAQKIVKDVLQETPLKINETKTRVSSIYGKNWNLGLMINDQHQITVGHKQKEIFRATLNGFCLEKHTFNSQAAQELLGKLQYFLSIEPEYFTNMLTKYQQKYNIDIKAELINLIRNASNEIPI
jgi:hypothetical protein